MQRKKLGSRALSVICAAEKNKAKSRWTAGSLEN
jgi:hypothetical protein